MANTLTLLSSSPNIGLDESPEAQVLRIAGDIIEAVVMHTPQVTLQFFDPATVPLSMLPNVIPNEDSGFRGDAWEMAIFGALSAPTRIADTMTSLVATKFGIPYARDAFLFAPNVARLNGLGKIMSNVERLVTKDAVLVTGAPGRRVLLRERLLAILRNECGILPPSASHLDKADIFFGNAEQGLWVAVSVKRPSSDLRVNEPGIRIGIYRTGSRDRVPEVPWYSHKDDPGFFVVPVPYDENFGMWFDSALKAVRVYQASRGNYGTTVDEALAGDRGARYVYHHLGQLGRTSIGDAIQVLRGERATGSKVLTPRSPTLVVPDKRILGPNGEVVSVLSSSLDLAPASGLLQ